MSISNFVQLLDTDCSKIFKAVIISGRYFNNFDYIDVVTRLNSITLDLKFTTVVSSYLATGQLPYTFYALLGFGNNPIEAEETMVELIRFDGLIWSLGTGSTFVRFVGSASLIGCNPNLLNEKLKGSTIYLSLKFQDHPLAEASVNAESFHVDIKFNYRRALPIARG